MWDFSVGKTAALMMRTLPFILVRIVVYFALTMAYTVAIGAVGAIGYGVGHISNNPGLFSFFGGFIGFGLVSAGLYWMREYILYIIKAGHIAVLVEIRNIILLGQEKCLLHEIISDRFIRGPDPLCIVGKLKAGGAVYWVIRINADQK